MLWLLKGLWWLLPPLLPLAPSITFVLIVFPSTAFACSPWPLSAEESGPAEELELLDPAINRCQSCRGRDCPWHQGQIASCQSLVVQSGNVDDGSITIRVMQQQTPNEQCQLNLFSLNVCH
ncbi:hypothetical protein TYRP_001066, partial [Tyrophagus putrescentiae]